jgi:hypothetical protein
MEEAPSATSERALGAADMINLIPQLANFLRNLEIKNSSRSIMQRYSRNRKL